MSISLNNHENRIKALEGRTSGSAFPNYSSALKLSNSSTDYTPPSNGFMSFDLFEGQSSTTWISINGTRYFQQYDGGWEEGTLNVFFPVTTSDRISWWYRGMHMSSGVGVFFIPAKIVYYTILEMTSSFTKEVLLCLFR